jgi:hypothetical protein
VTRAAGFAAILGTVLAAAAVFGCVPQPPSPPPTPGLTAAPTASPPPLGWVEHAIPELGIALSLPDGWLAFSEADVSDPETRAELERDFTGADALFGRLDAQGRQARVVFVGVDGRARGTGRFAAALTLVAVEPTVPRPLLGIGADFAVAALEGAFVIETPVERARLQTPLGEGIRIAFEHRVLGPAGGRGMLIEHDGVLATTGDATFLLSRNAPAGAPTGPLPGLEDVVATLRTVP